MYSHVWAYVLAHMSARLSLSVLIIMVMVTVTVLLRTSTRFSKFQNSVVSPPYATILPRRLYGKSHDLFTAFSAELHDKAMTVVDTSRYDAALKARQGHSQDATRPPKNATTKPSYALLYPRV